MNFIYEVVMENGTYYYNTVDDLCNDFSLESWTEEGCNLREELWLQPKLWYVLGPMYGGIKDGKTVIRYESQLVYNSLSI